MKPKTHTIWIEVTDFAEAPKVYGEYYKKKPKNPLSKFIKAKITLPT